jgi:hypothetical protein
MQTRQMHSRTAIAIALTALCGAIQAQTQTATADWTPEVKGAVTYGAGVRTHAQKAGLAPGGSSNTDDGNINYDKGDLFSSVAKAFGSLNMRNRSGLGIALSAMAWYDRNLESHDVPHGNNPDAYIPGPLSDQGFSHEARFKGLSLLNAHLYGSNQVGVGTLSWRVGRLAEQEATPFTFTGGLRDLETRNTAASSRPGALPEEGLMPVWAGKARWDVTPLARVEGFLQFRPEQSRGPGCGTFLSSNDYTEEGCNRVFYSHTLTERQNVLAGIFTARSPDVTPDSKPDRFGLGGSYNFAAIDTRIGGFYAHYHSRNNYTSVLRGAALGPTGGSTYLLEYPSDKNLFALTAETRLPGRGVRWNNELSVTNGQPVQLNTSDLQQAFLKGTGALGADAKAATPGSIYHGYDRFRVIQAQTGLVKDFENVLGAARGYVGAELGVKHVVGLPNVALRRYGRPEATEACATAAECAATNDGFVTTNAWAYRIHAGLDFRNVGGTEIRLRPSATFTQDVKGWSYDYGFIQGRKSLRLALDADFTRAIFGNFTYAASRGGQFNTRKDRDYVLASMGVKF